MKLKFLNSASKRAGFSFGISSILLIASWLFTDYEVISMYFILVGTVVVYVPITLFYAIASTFFVRDEKEDSTEILDD